MKVEFNIMSLSFIFLLLKLPNKRSEPIEYCCMRNMYDGADDTFSETCPILTPRRTTQQVKSHLVLVFSGLIPALPMVALGGYIKERQNADTDTVFILYELLKLPTTPLFLCFV